jgi:hypothetical protein
MENLIYKTNTCDSKSIHDIEPIPDIFSTVLQWNADQNDIYNAWRMVVDNILEDRIKNHQIQ